MIEGMEQSDLPTVTFYEAALTDGTELLLLADRAEYPASRWDGFFEDLHNKDMSPAIHAAMFDMNFMPAIGHSLAGWTGDRGRDEIAHYVGERFTAFSRLFRALAGCRPFDQGMLDRAGIAKLTPLAIEKAGEWSKHRRVAEAAA